MLQTLPSFLKNRRRVIMTSHPPIALMGGDGVELELQAVEDDRRILIRIVKPVDAIIEVKRGTSRGKAGWVFHLEPSVNAKRVSVK